MATKPQPIKNAPSIETLDQFLDNQEAEIAESFTALNQQLRDIHDSLRHKISNLRREIHEAHVLSAELNSTFLNAAQRIEQSLSAPAEQSPDPQG